MASNDLGARGHTLAAALASLELRIQALEYAVTHHQGTIKPNELAQAQKDAGADRKKLEKRYAELLP